MDWLRFISSGAIDSVLFYLPAIIFNFGIYLHFTVVLRSDLLPFDGGATLGGQPLFGGGRSVDSLYIAVLSGFLCGLPSGNFLEPMYLAIGAHAGTLASSFLKRRLKIPRGKRSDPIDSTDFIFGSTLLYASRFPMEWSRLWFGIAMLGFGHMFINSVVRPRFESRFADRFHSC